MTRTCDLLVRSHCCAKNHRLAVLPTFAHECAFSITSSSRVASLNSAAMQGVGILLGIPQLAETELSWRPTKPVAQSCELAGRALSVRCRCPPVLTHRR